jgi:hypothetical protein
VVNAYLRTSTSVRILVHFMMRVTARKTNAPVR